MIIAASKNSEFAGIAHKENPIFGLSSPSYLFRPTKINANARWLGVQFHPELEHVRPPKSLHQNSL